MSDKLGVMANKLDLGPTGERVRDNIRRARGGMQFKDLAQRLDDLGHYIPTLGLRRIESGERRVSVDDLMALAVALDMSPLALLLPRDGSRMAASGLTGVPARQVAHNTQWLWAMGEQPLELSNNGQGQEAANEIALFQAKNKPRIDSRSLVFTQSQSAGQIAQAQGLRPHGDD